jgi:hypothetical protein
MGWGPTFVIGLGLLLSQALARGVPTFQFEKVATLNVRH